MKIIKENVRNKDNVRN